VSAANVKARSAGRSQNPVGSCMVSSEGACAAHYTYGRFREIAVHAA
jgi:hydrogenase expression/formation protein HypD